MPSETDLLNDALGQCGQTKIGAIDDGSTNANWCAVFYPSLRRAMLRTHHWPFATGRMELGQDTIPPAFEFAFSYTLPAYILKITEYNGDAIQPVSLNPWYWTFVAGRYKIEGNKLLTNDGVVKIVYVRDTDVALWDPLSYQMLATILASKLAKAINKDNNLAQTLLKEALEWWTTTAVAVSSQEGTNLPYVSEDLTWGR